VNLTQKIVLSFLNRTRKEKGGRRAVVALVEGRDGWSRLGGKGERKDSPRDLCPQKKGVREKIETLPLTAFSKGEGQISSKCALLLTARERGNTPERKRTSQAHNSIGRGRGGSRSFSI